MTSSQTIRDQLTLRINAATHPSRLINQIGLADRRSAESTRALTRLTWRSPRVLQVIRAELREEFDIDPDSLLFTELPPSTSSCTVESLTDKALLLLVRPAVEANVNRFIVLSVKGEPNRRLPYTPLDVLRRVIAMRLFERLDRAATDYWLGLADGSWLTRREHWVQLQRALFADRAFMARQLDELSSAGMAMVQALIDAPTAEARQHAGAAWARVKVGQLMWPGNESAALPGALHIFVEGDASPVLHVIYLPGVTRNFHEYSSLDSLQRGLLALGEAVFDNLWQCLPLGRRNELCAPDNLSRTCGFVGGIELLGDALTWSAESLLDGQWSNELACAVQINHAYVFSTQTPARRLSAVPFLTYVERARKQLVGSARLGDLREPLLKWDQQRRGAEIAFASAGSNLALHTAEQQLTRYEMGLVALLQRDDPSVETAAYKEVLSLMSQLNAHHQALTDLLLGAQQRLLKVSFWTERPAGKQSLRRASLFMQAQTEALRCEVELQHRLKLLSTAHRDLVIEVVEQPLASKREGSETQVLSIAVGIEPDAFYAIHNLWVVTTASALRRPARQLPVTLCAFGRSGAVKAFAGLDALIHSLKASLNSRDDSVLWRYVERNKRKDLRGHAARETLAVRLVPIEGKPAFLSLKKLLGSYDRLHKSDEDITRIFSEVTDAAVSRELLMVELQDHLKMPVNSLLNQAQTTIELLRKAAAEAKKMPAWLANATPVQHKGFRRLQRVYLSGVLAYQQRVEQHLPGLDTFAQRALTTRLRQDGIAASLDIYQPFIDMPDDVTARYCSSPSFCTRVGQMIVYTPTTARTTFSLMQLALHNLDPLAAWTDWRFRYARFLQPEWKRQINSTYLISTVSALDIAGQYDRLLNRVFYPPGDAHGKLGEGRIPPLLNRALQACFAQQLFSSVQEGLSVNDQCLFNTAMAARTSQDLLKNQHQLQLYVVHLVGHTMQHDRYIAGIVAVHDKRSGRCLVYWPKAPEGMVLTLYSCLQHAHTELNCIGALPDNARALARQVAPCWAFEAITHHPIRADERAQEFNMFDRVTFAMVNGVRQSKDFIRSFAIRHLEPTAVPEEIEQQTFEQIASDPQNWLALVATSHSNAQALLYRASLLARQRQTQAVSRSATELQSYRIRRIAERRNAALRNLVASSSSVIGWFIDVYELLLAARHYHRFGDSDDAIDVGFRTALIATDLLLSFLPGPRRIGAVKPRTLQPTLRSALGQLKRWRMTAQAVSAPSPVTRLNALERFQRKGVPEGAVALKGLSEQGVFVKNGELFVADDSSHYPLYRRDKEPFYRLKNQQAPGKDELILSIHRPGEWLLDADAPQPVAGSSSGRLNPWRAPAQPPPDWQSPTSATRVATHTAIVQSYVTTDHWTAWSIPFQRDMQLISSDPEVFQITQGSSGARHKIIRMAPANVGPADPSSSYFRLLSEGDQAPLDNIVFIRKDDTPGSSARADIERWTSTALDEQPLAVSRIATGGWLVHAPLFDRSLPDYVGAAFPTMTHQSRAFAAARMIELSDPDSAATASHLLNIRATLDRWLPAAPARPGQTDDLLRMLRPTKRSGVNVNIGFEGMSPGFIRVDFTPPFSLNPRLKFVATAVGDERFIAQHAAVRAVLEAQGFSVLDLSVRRQGATAGLGNLESIATHIDSDKLYYLTYRWIGTGQLSVGKKLTDAWINVAIKQHDASLLMAAVDNAMRSGRLGRIFAGIQWPTKDLSPPSVYFVKVDSLH
ncbi:dermonecrotic toxin domain-containing protein [Pseudomonas sp. GNP013]